MDRWNNTICTVGVAQPIPHIQKAGWVEDWLAQQSPALVVSIGALYFLYREFKLLQKSQTEIINQNAKVIAGNSEALFSLKDIIEDGMQASMQATNELRRDVEKIQDTLEDLRSNQDKVIGYIQGNVKAFKGLTDKVDALKN